MRTYRNVPVAIMLCSNPFVRFAAGAIWRFAGLAPWELAAFQWLLKYGQVGNIGISLFKEAHGRMVGFYCAPPYLDYGV